MTSKPSWCTCEHKPSEHMENLGVCMVAYCYCHKDHTKTETPVGINPKDLIGAKKVDLSNIPPIVSALMALGLMDGDRKYGPFNWRNPEKKVGIRAYIAATKRHLDLFLEREEVADDSGIPHLGHAMASLAVITDAYYNGFANDDRPPKGEYPRLVADINRQIKEKAEKK